MDSKKRVLVAEDHPATRNLIQIVLERYGYQVVPTPDGEAALKACCESAPDLAILDVKMPKKTAWEVLAELEVKNLLTTFPIIVLTASMSADKLAARFEGICLTLMKPFEIESLIAAVEKCREGSRLNAGR